MTPTKTRRIKPYFVLSWNIKAARKILAGHGVMVSYALVAQKRVTAEDVAGLAALGCDIVIDNGEFTAWKGGGATDGPAFYAFLRELSERGILWKWAAALDVIGSAEGTRANWRHALATYPDLAQRLVPVFHEGDPWELLAEYDPDTRLVALGRTGGRESKRKTFEWYDGCFNRYPEGQFHLLGNGSPETIEPYPAESFDASTWDRNTGFTNALGFPFNRCSRELRQRAYVEACETLEYRAPKQLSLFSTAERTDS